MKQSTDIKLANVHFQDGILTIDEHGTILSTYIKTDCKDESVFDEIGVFFVDEYIAFYGKFEKEIDSQCIGYWYKDGEYVPPSVDSRNYGDYLCFNDLAYEEMKSKRSFKQKLKELVLPR